LLDMHVAGARNTYCILVGKTLEKPSDGKPRRRFEGSVKMNPREAGSLDSSVGMATGYGLDGPG
jgi:hypothetical protein